MYSPLKALGLLPLFHRNDGSDETRADNDRDQPISHSIPV
jgi:hypothetical protein